MVTITYERERATIRADGTIRYEDCVPISPNVCDWRQTCRPSPYLRRWAETLRDQAYPLAPRPAGTAEWTVEEILAREG